MVKVRFAPSPTGDLHIGNAWTALINFAFSRKEKGVFILRIEDTDRERSSPAYETSIMEDLDWLGIKYDGGPIRQSERLALYRQFANSLLEKGYAYKCFCTREMLEKEREEALKMGIAPRYGERCRFLSASAVKRFEREKRPYVVRFKSMKEALRFKDEIRGTISFPENHVDDFILLKEDHTPTYNFAAVVDDMLMGITHVIRGADHLSNTPKQIMILKAFSQEIPSYAHHSLLLGEDGKPLSKRHGVTKIKELKEIGILRDAIVNYLLLIGRKDDGKLLSLEELIASFSLSSLSESDARFDMDKLLWFNREYIRRLPAERLIVEAGLKPDEKRRIEVIKENLKTLSEIKTYLQIFHGSEVEREAVSCLSSISEAKEILIAFEDLINRGEKDFDVILNTLQEKLKFSKKTLFLVLRIILTGRLSGPPLRNIFELIEEKAIKERIACLKGFFSANSP